MRELKINKSESKLSIEKFDNKLVAKIALRFAKKKDELDELYDLNSQIVNKEISAKEYFLKRYELFEQAKKSM